MRTASMHPRATLALTDLADTFAAQIRRLRIGGAACDTPGFVEAGIFFLSVAGTVRDCQPMRANVRLRLAVETLAKDFGADLSYHTIGRVTGDTIREQQTSSRTMLAAWESVGQSIREWITQVQSEESQEATT